MKNIVVKLPGAGMILEKDIEMKVPWHQYRKNSINSEYIEQVISAIEITSKNMKIALVCGGIGAFLYIELAKSLKIKNEECRSVGIKIFNIVSQIIIDAMLIKNIKVFPNLVSLDHSFEDLFDKYDILVFEANQNFISSDSLAADIAVKLKSDQLIYFKNGIPHYYVGFSQVTELEEIEIHELLTRAKKYASTPGSHFWLDVQAIEIISKNKIPTVLINKDSINDLHLLLNHKIKVPSTRILFGS